MAAIAAAQVEGPRPYQWERAEPLEGEQDCFCLNHESTDVILAHKNPQNENQLICRVHRMCLKRWQEQQAGQNQPLTCQGCRQPCEPAPKTWFERTMERLSVGAGQFGEGALRVAEWYLDDFCNQNLDRPRVFSRALRVSSLVAVTLLIVKVVVDLAGPNIVTPWSYVGVAIVGAFAGNAIAGGLWELRGHFEQQILSLRLSPNARTFARCVATVITSAAAIGTVFVVAKLAAVAFGGAIVFTGAGLTGNIGTMAASSVLVSALAIEPSYVIARLFDDFA